LYNNAPFIVLISLGTKAMQHFLKGLGHFHLVSDSKSLIVAQFDEELR